MNIDPGVKVEVMTKVLHHLPQSLGFPSAIKIRINEEIKELVQDHNGMVTHLGSYLHPDVDFEFATPSFRSSTISHLLNRQIPQTQLCQLLGQKIADDCAFLRGSFLIDVNVKLIREVRFMLPPSVPLSSGAASDALLQRLVEEQRVEPVDLEEEEKETTCSICMESLSEDSGHDENIIQMPECLHMFHQGCIFEWLKRQNSCPLCRRVPYC